MVLVNVQGAGHDYGIDVFLIEQLTMIVVGANVRRHRLRFSMPSCVDVGDCDQFGIGNGDNLFQQLLAAAADPDHAHAHAVVGSQHAGRWIHHECSGTDCGLFQKVTSKNRLV